MTKPAFLLLPIVVAVVLGPLVAGLAVGLSAIVDSIIIHPSSESTAAASRYFIPARVALNCSVAFSHGGQQ